MSFIYSSLYLITNILVPIGFMIYTEAKCFIWPNKNWQQLQKQGEENSQISKVQENHFKVYYGRWVMLIISIFAFNIFSFIFPRSLIIIFFGLITKAIIIKSPESLVCFFLFKNVKVQQAIQKLHLEVYSQMLIQKMIDFYLNFSEKLNFYIVFYRIQEKDDRIQILNRMKDSVSRIQLELQDDEQIKNKSFIVAVKKMQNTSKKIKSYENVGVNCDILKGSEIGKELLKILQEKTLPKERINAPSISKIQEPTKDRQIGLKNAKSTVYTPRSESLQQKMKKIKQGVNIPTSEKKMFPNQDEEQSHFTIKRSQTFDIEEFEFQESPISKKRENNHVSYGPARTQKIMTKKIEYSQTVTINKPQNMGILDIETSQKTITKKNQINPDGGSMGQILQALNQTNQGNQPQILPADINISSIDQNTIHPFKVNLSSLTNPLIISGQQNQRSKILTPSLYNSQQNLLMSSGKNNNGISNNNPSKKEHLTNVSQVHTEIMMEKKFSEQSSIPNKLQVSISESQYSDMFESEGQEEEPKLEIKVEAVVQNQTSAKGLKPRLDIVNIELYDNKDIKFLSVYNHLIFSGKILRMYKKPDNFYEVICEESTKIIDGKQVQQKDQKVQVIKKVKFRGQAKPFMKYLTKNEQ